MDGNGLTAAKKNISLWKIRASFVFIASKSIGVANWSSRDVLKDYSNKIYIRIKAQIIVVHIFVLDLVVFMSGSLLDVRHSGRFGVYKSAVGAPLKKSKWSVCSDGSPLNTISKFINTGSDWSIYLRQLKADSRRWHVLLQVGREKSPKNVRSTRWKLLRDEQTSAKMTQLYLVLGVFFVNLPHRLVTGESSMVLW